jgi:hypothetical protein
MNVANIRERLELGFKPFAIARSSGRRLPLPHRDDILVGRNVPTVDVRHLLGLQDLPAGKAS